jgi:integrase
MGLTDTAIRKIKPREKQFKLADGKGLFLVVYPDVTLANAREWFAKHSPRWVASHKEKIIRRFEKDIFPWVGNRPITAITDPKSIGELLRVINDYQGYFVTKCALRLAPLFFVRPGELRTAEWSEFNFEIAEWAFLPQK